MSKKANVLKAPFPYFGGKSKVAELVWDRLGDVKNYVEPFAGSLAVLLARPHSPRIETVNDLDGMVANFWRSLASNPDEVAENADWPVNELDLHARHKWLANTGREKVEKLRDDPEWYDAKIAGWWVWGISQWIGSGWCSGVHRQSLKRPHLGDAGTGVHRQSLQRPHLGDAGKGVHRQSLQKPHLGDSGEASGLYAYMRELASRIRRVRVCCGNWSRVLGRSVTTAHGLTGVFLDPPYDQSCRDPDLYAVETPVAADVRAWCAEHGQDPLLRIALCGYDGEGHESLEALGWSVVAWKSHGGYGRQSKTSAGRANAKRERIWFSPHCLSSTLFTGEQ